ncbi:hypothetical protein H2203_007775 [Taxawa tesnikishii (nom. ined.)]|nr:hypothetical protein H2203_007775 [Dothideales sp. JES 119]
MSGYENRPLPPLPTLQDSPSFESERRPSAEVEPLAVPSRPRAHRNISFRSFISRSHFPSPPAGKHESVFSNATTASFSSIDSVCSDDSHNDFSSNASTAPSTAPSSRRPSALSFSRKTEKESKRPASRKGSTASQSPRRRGLFGGSFTEEEVPPMPPTPATPAPAEFTCRPCYYSSARNCPGFVIAGTHGQACENCNALGFFGAP